MDQIQHKLIQARGLNYHVAEIGTGFRAIAPDFRGYGLADQPTEPEKTTFADMIDDLVGILDALEIAKVVLVGKDFGARSACILPLLHPDRVLGVVTIGIPFVPPGPAPYHKYLPEGFYINRWIVPGRAEAEFGRFDAKTVVRSVYILFSGSELPIAAENQEVMDLVDPSTPLPSWFFEEDLAAYGALYEKSSFRTALQSSAYPEVKLKATSLLIMGSRDYILKFPGMEDYTKSGAVKEFVPDLEIVYLTEGTHFVQEQSPDEVNQLILTFLNARICS
ncbi:epoxide hydrolase, putative [Ricinus communis]|uniref:Epoxide hydrolase, putative n=1 Tax=Ricinus communis TaxID=3988 RepID=B9RZ60_RICCO|nr:epoxide hydrolase, putative [Ricinus communis]